VPSAAPPVPPRPPRSAPPLIPEPADAPPPPPGFDWESMLGVRGAAWLGGVALVIAALFFAKWSIDQGFFSPVIRIVMLLVAGTAALVLAELKLRDGYQTTANALSGAGVVTLYSAFFAGHTLYQLFSLATAFVGMSLVTVVAAVIAIRFGARFTALIGLSGGLATPVLLSTGVDRPVAFFSYLAVLAAGFLHVAERRSWTSVTALTLIGISMLELGWYASAMTPEKLTIGTTAFAVLGGLFLRHAARTRDLQQPQMLQAALAGAIVPLVFAVLLAAQGQYARHWVTLIVFLVVVSAALHAVALRSGLRLLTGAAAVAAGLVMLVLGGSYELIDRAAWALPVAGIVLTAGYNALPRFAAAWDSGPPPASRLALVVGAATMAGLLGFSWLAIDDGTLPLWAFIALVGMCLGVAIERTRGGSWPGAFPLAVLAIAWVCRHWVTARSVAETYGDHLTIPHLFAVAVAIAASWRAMHARPTTPLEPWRTEHAATMAAAGVAFLTALTGLTMGAGGRPWPMFLLTGLDAALVLAVAVQVQSGPVVAVAATMAMMFNWVWHAGYFGIAHIVPASMAYTAAYLVFLAWPFAAARWLSASWRTQPAPWLVSALVGPATFPLYDAMWRETWGPALVGVVPVVMAIFSVAALYGVTRNFAASVDPDEARRRLNYLALFAAIALGFVATAIPLQLARQWITIGWALEAAAVWWLFGMLPHSGLKYFGLALFVAVGVRLLLNGEVLHYQPRGAPIVNWLLYTYGLPALCCFAGAYFIREAERRRGPGPEYDWLARDRDTPGPIVGFLGLLLVFWLINLEIADYFSAGRYVELDFSRHLARDLTRSFAWGLYALAILGLGLWRAHRGLRLVSLGFLLLTVAKVFLYDLGQLTGLYRIMSFLALGISLILVSLLYQRFGRRSEVIA
jgi:uncharacterized membrane protein